MIHDKNVIKNRNNLIQMIALSEDVVRTSQGVYSLISNTMNNPEESSNIKPLIEELYKKVIELKKFNVRLPLIEEEIIELPDPRNASVTDPDYIEPKKEETLSPQIKETPEPVEPLKTVETPEPPVGRPEPPVKTPETPEPPVKTTETTETTETPKDREVRVPKKSRVPRKNPRKPLNNKKNLPSPDIDSI
tara:strand:- start:124 stop:696 length:573 start_codon:yes stop_codon:yes gene_type:complete